MARCTPQCLTVEQHLLKIEALVYYMSSCNALFHVSTTDRYRLYAYDRDTNRMYITLTVDSSSLHATGSYRRVGIWSRSYYYKIPSFDSSRKSLNARDFRSSHGDKRRLCCSGLLSRGDQRVHTMSQLRRNILSFGSILQPQTYFQLVQLIIFHGSSLFLGFLAKSTFAFPISYVPSMVYVILTERCGAKFGAPALYSGCQGFKSRP